MSSSSSSTAVAYSKFSWIELSVSVQLCVLVIDASDWACIRPAYRSPLTGIWGDRQFLKDRGVQDLLKPRESATSKGSIESPMIEGNRTMTLPSASAGP
jgi:hypothetical protein